MTVQIRAAMSFRFMSSVYTVSILVSGLAVCLTLLLQPTIVSMWNPWYRQQLIHRFLDTIVTTQTLDAQELWLFRERLSPGSMTFNTAAVDMFQTYRIVAVEPEKDTLLMTFTSAALRSTDTLTKNQYALDEVQKQLPEGTTVRTRTPQLLLAELPDKSMFLSALMPLSELKRANGFFDYLPSEEEQIRGAAWLHQSYIVKE